MLIVGNDRESCSESDSRQRLICEQQNVLSELFIYWLCYKYCFKGDVKIHR